MKLNQRDNVAIIPEFLTFRRMIAPDLLQFIFWPTVVVGIYYNAWFAVLDGYNIAWFSLSSGIMILRVAFECLFLYTYLRKTA